MLSRIALQSVRHLSQASSKQKTVTRKLTDYRKSLIVAGIGSSLVCFDYFYRDGQSIPAATRFVRSLKMGAEISLDYSFGLWGLDEESEEYDKVCLKPKFAEKSFLISGFCR